MNGAVLHVYISHATAETDPEFCLTKFSGKTFFGLAWVRYPPWPINSGQGCGGREGHLWSWKLLCSQVIGQEYFSVEGRVLGKMRLFVLTYSSSKHLWSLLCPGLWAMCREQGTQQGLSHLRV